MTSLFSSQTLTLLASNKNIVWNRTLLFSYPSQVQCRHTVQHWVCAGTLTDEGTYVSFIWLSFIKQIPV